MITGSLTLHKRLPSLRMQARSLRYSAVLANRAGSQSTYKLRRQGLSSGWDGFPSELMMLLAPLTKIRTISIIQGWVERSATHQNYATPNDELHRAPPILLKTVQRHIR